MDWAAAAWVIIGFFSGALPFSVWVGKLALRTDIRAVGDSNPGAFNVLRAGGTGWFVVAMLLDGVKGAVPAGIANFVLNIEGGWLIAIALAPILGHAAGPFLKFKGGKALAVTFGVWTGLTLFLMPTLLGIFYALWRKLLKNDGWAVLAGQASLFASILAINPDPVWIAVWGGSTIVFAWKYRADLKGPGLSGRRGKRY